MRKRASLIEKAPGSITFCVDDVMPADTLLPVRPLRGSLEQATSKPLLELSHEPSFPVVWKEGLVAHALVGAVFLAFSEHRPLILGPDEVWIAIEQGLAQHINNNSEELRGRFVEFAAKKLLQIDGALPAWTKAELWTQMIRDHVGRSVYDLMVADFSTTTAVARTASEVVMMDAFKRYFEYEECCICGIPRVTLLGVPEDWREIQRRVQFMSRYDLDWWTERLEPIVEGMIATAEGRPDLDFWQSIFSPSEDYGFTTITGWLINLFPYLKHQVTGQYTERNRFVPWPRRSEDSEPDRESRAGPHFSRRGSMYDQLPCGLSMAPFRTVMKPPGKKEETLARELLGGFVGVVQDEGSGALRAELGWAMREGDQYPAVLSQIAATHPVGRRQAWKTTTTANHLPADIVQMLDVFDGADLVDGMVHPVRILPLGQFRSLRTAAGTGETVLFVQLDDGRHVGYRCFRNIRHDLATRRPFVEEGWEVVLVESRPQGLPGAVQTGIETERVIGRSIQEFIIRIVETRGAYYFDEGA